MFAGIGNRAKGQFLADMLAPCFIRHIGVVDHDQMIADAAERHLRIFAGPFGTNAPAPAAIMFGKVDDYANFPFQPAFAPFVATDS